LVAAPVAIHDARHVVHLVLDEPNSGLAVTTSLVLRSLVRALAAEGRMVLYCSHVLAIVEQIATDILVLQDGGVAAHVTATAMAGLFSFFFLILAQGVLLSVFGRAIARRLALVLQSVFVVVLLQALIFVPFIGSLVGAFRNDQPLPVAIAAGLLGMALWGLELERSI
jgi:energy-coupling factor transporter ATP-binding protein EcfA2